MNFFKNHPAVAAALIIGVAFVGSAFVISRDVPLNVADRAQASPSSALRENILEKDSDGDGLFDWEETLWGTDPFMVDTDGDGILDGEYVRSRSQNRTPEEIVAEEDLNFTEQFSRTFFTEYLRYRDDGEFTPSEQSALISRLLGTVRLDLPVATSPNVVITTEATDEAVVEYFVSIALLVQEASPEGVVEGELDLLEKALRERSDQALSDIRKIGKGYKNLSASLQETPAPVSLRANHAAMITSTARLGEIISIFAEALDNAVYVLAALPEYEKEALRLAETFRTVNESVKKGPFSTEDAVISVRQALGL